MIQEYVFNTYKNTLKQRLKVRDGSSKILQNISILSHHYMASQSGGLEFRLTHQMSTMVHYVTTVTSQNIFFNRCHLPHNLSNRGVSPIRNVWLLAYRFNQAFICPHTNNLQSLIPITYRFQ